MSNNFQVCFVVAVAMFAVSINAAKSQAQLPSFQELIRNVDQAAEEQKDTKPFLGFQKVKLPKMLDGLVDLRFKKPSLPNLGILDRLKNIGKPSFGDDSTARMPILAGLGKLFSPPAKTSSGFLDRIFGRQNADSEGQFLSKDEMQELNGIAKNLQSQAKRMSDDAKDGVRNIFSPLDDTPKPPYRTARQYQGSSSRR